MATNMRTIEEDVPWVYIELTHESIEQRKFYHLYASKVDMPKQEIHRAIKYLGTQCFKWEILEETDDLNEANELFKYYCKEYQSDTIGYNKVIHEDHVRHNDHRTWEEMYGKEKADAMKKHHSEVHIGKRTIMSEYHSERTKRFHPMRTEEARDKSRQKQLGNKNHYSLYEYTLTSDDGKIIKTDCLVDFCRKNEGFDVRNVRKAIHLERKYKGYTVKRTLKKGKEKYMKGKRMEDKRDE